MARPPRDNRLCAPSTMTTRGWAVGDVLSSSQWATPRTVARVHGRRVWLRSAAHTDDRPLRTFPPDTRKVAA